MRRTKNIIVDSLQGQFSSINQFEGGMDTASPSKKGEGDSEKKKEEISIPITKFWSTLRGYNRCILTFGILASFVAGLLLPSIAIVMGSVTGAFDPSNGTSINEIMGALLKNILAVAMTIWVFGYIQYAFMQQISESIAIDLRGKYLRSLLKQEVAFFEMNSVETMPTDIGQYFNQISLGIGEAFSMLLNSLGVFLGGLGIALYKGPVFTMVCMAYMPLVMFAVTIFGGISKRAQFMKLGANQALGGFTEETLSSLKLIVSFA